MRTREELIVGMLEKILSENKILKLENEILNLKILKNEKRKNGNRKFQKSKNSKRT